MIGSLTAPENRQPAFFPLLAARLQPLLSSHVISTGFATARTHFCCPSRWISSAPAWRISSGGRSVFSWPISRNTVFWSFG